MRTRLSYLLFAFVFVLLFLVECAIKKNATSTLDVATIDYPVPKGWPKPVYDFQSNPPDKNKIAIGRKLFFDPNLSEDGMVSCETCHSPYLAFAHSDHKLSHGIYDLIGTRNSPALMNLAWQPNFMWDGSINDLDEQPLNPLTSHIEMRANLDSVLLYLNSDSTYSSMFHNAFNEGASIDNMLASLSQFMLQFKSSRSKYDRVINGEKGVSFNVLEEKGYEVFKMNCAECHTEPLFTNYSFQSNGLKVDTTLNDSGRMMVTQKKTDSLLFRVPTLRNIEVTAPYMHDGRYRNLQMVLFHYSTLDTTAYNLHPSLKKMDLTEDDKRNLVQFLRTLTDPSFLYNKELQAPRLNSF